ncbi:hypothetical protein M413DRAFT_27478 [Hebeloma cylindrosporum]|uniref:Pali-domain-containing protein n=1 Tax=Hebeloma cylindrosporum TaxID=76867 RepID=A0A0C3CE78_HEBCY|nr:hypothetical protein M413DRAFT_27478 [Hebeloma cylindrosporum h7]
MSRAFCIPGLLFLLCALVLNILVSVSLPFLPALDIVRTHFGTGVRQANTEGLTQVRFGIWAPCYYNGESDRTCLKSNLAYNLEISNAARTETANVSASWTRGLAAHPLAAAITLLAFAFAFSTHLVLTLVGSLLSFLAALVTLVAFAIDIALFARVRHEMSGLGVDANTNTAPAFWMTLVAFVLLLLAGCTVCLGRRKSRMADATPTTPVTPTTSKPGFFSKFRRNEKAA